MRYVVNPPSVEISQRLTEAQAETCEHGKNPCYLLCGVASKRSYVPKYQDIRIKWRPVSNRERRAIWDTLRKGAPKCK